MILLKSLVKYCTVFAVNAKLTVDVSDRIGDITHGAGGFLYGVADEEVPTSNTLVPLKPKVLCTGTMLTTEHPYGDTEYVTEQFLEEGDSVYLVVTHPSGFHSYDNIVVSVKNVPAISSSSDLSTAYSTGGSYVLGQDVVTVSNAGTSDEGNLQNGSINGNGGIMLCGTDTPGGAMLFHNTAANWTCSNMTIDGNKDNVTHTDACLWFMGGADITFENAVIRNFRTSAAERMAVTNVGGTVTFDNVEFSGNENTGENSEKFGEYTDIYSAPWGDASIVLKGATKAKIYYVSGNIDVSGLSEGCDISVKADQADGYEYLKGLVCDNEAVSIEYDDENMTVTFTGTTAAE